MMRRCIAVLALTKAKGTIFEGEFRYTEKEDVPAGSTTSFIATFPERAKSGFRKDANQSMTSWGE